MERTLLLPLPEIEVEVFHDVDVEDVEEFHDAEVDGVEELHGIEVDEFHDGTIDEEEFHDGAVVDDGKLLVALTVGVVPV